MTTQVAERFIEKPFLWRQQGGIFIHPSKMETRHLFYTIKMIWNHSRPEKTGRYNEYIFDDFYTDEYMRMAIICIMAELNERHDIKKSWQADLDFMYNCLLKDKQAKVNSIRGISNEIL